MREIKIKSGHVGRYDDVSPFIVEHGELILNIPLPEKSGEFYLVTELNGKNFDTALIPRSGTITLSGLDAGELRAEVKHYLRGTLIEVFKVEPLILKAVERRLSATPEIAVLTEEIARLKREQSDAAEWLKTGFSAVREDSRTRAVSFLAFAYAVYRNSPLLNGKGFSAEEFSEALGFGELTEEELKEVKNFEVKL